MSQTLSASTLLAVPLAAAGRLGSCRCSGHCFRWQPNRTQGQPFADHPRRLHRLRYFRDDALQRRPRWRPFQPDALRVDGGRRSEDGTRLPCRWPHSHDDVRRDLRVADGAHLHPSATWRKTRATTASSPTSRCSPFSMLMLVMSNNMLQLFFGWEAVGLVSYLLIGFWFNRPTRSSRT